jgi:putative ABC transport system permease protein
MWVAGWDTIRVDRGVLLFAVILTLLVGVLFGVFSAMRTPARDLHKSLKEGGRIGRGGSARHRLRSALVISEVALAMVLLAGAALLAKGFLRLVHLYHGLEPENVLSMEVTLPERKYTDDTKVAAYFDSLLRGIGELPGVESAGAVRNLPASNVENATTPFTIEGRPSRSAAEMPVADLQSATPDYFRVLRIPLVSGSVFSPGDNLLAPRVALVSRTMAQRFWPGDDPVGKRIQLGKPDSASAWITIAGVIGDVKQNWFEPGLHSVIYLPVAQAPRRTLAVVVRTTGDPMQAAAPLRALAQKLDAEIALADLQPMDKVIGDALAPIKIIGTLMIVFGGVALCLAAVGVYGVLSNSVAQRTQEFGIRMALGAQPGNLRKVVLGQAARLSGAGLAIGVALALAMNRVMASMLYGIVDLDFLILVEFAATLGVVALMASYQPAWRATRVDPMVALREE